MARHLRRGRQCRQSCSFPADLSTPVNPPESDEALVVVGNRLLKDETWADANYMLEMMYQVKRHVLAHS